MKTNVTSSATLSGLLWTILSGASDTRELVNQFLLMYRRVAYTSGFIMTSLSGKKIKLLKVHRFLNISSHTHLDRVKPTVMLVENLTYLLKMRD